VVGGYEFLDDKKISTPWYVVHRDRLTDWNRVNSRLPSSVFRLPEVTFLTNVSSTSVIGTQATKEGLPSLVDQSSLEDMHNPHWIK
jgi:hypothetical protein